MQLKRTEGETGLGVEISAGGETLVVGEGIGYLLNYAAKTIAHRHAGRLAKHGVPLGQWPVLMFLWARDGQTQSELSRGVVIENSTMVRTLDRMERDGLVRRVRSDRDRRRINIFLTERGWSLREDLIPCANATEEEATRNLTEEEKAQFKELLGRVISSIEESDAESNPKP